MAPDVIHVEQLENMYKAAKHSVEVKAQSANMPPHILLSLIEEAQRLRLFSARIYGLLAKHHPDAQQWLDAALAAQQGVDFMPEYLPDTGTEIMDGDAQWLRVLRHPVAGDVLYRRGHGDNGPSTVVEIFVDGKFGHAIQDFLTVPDRDESFASTTDEQVCGMVEILLQSLDGVVTEN